MGSDFIVHVPAHEELSQKKGLQGALCTHLKLLGEPRLYCRGAVITFPLLQASVVTTFCFDGFTGVWVLIDLHLTSFTRTCVRCGYRSASTLRPLIRRTLLLASGPSHQALTINKDVQEHAAGRKCFSTAATALEALHAVGGMTARASKYCALML